jgi:hypothetical protein
MSVSYRDSLNLLLRNSGSSSQATGAYSVGSPGKFYLEAPVSTGTLGQSDYVAASNYDIAKLSINLVVAGDLTADGYGDGVILTNGIKATIENSSGDELYDFLDGETIKSNADWYKLGVDIDPLLEKSATNAHLTGSSSMLINFGDYHRINPGDRFVLTFQDDFSVGGATNAMVEHSFMLSGRISKDIGC